MYHKLREGTNKVSIHDAMKPFSKLGEWLDSRSCAAQKGRRRLRASKYDALDFPQLLSNEDPQLPSEKYVFLSGFTPKLLQQRRAGRKAREQTKNKKARWTQNAPAYVIRKKWQKMRLCAGVEKKKKKWRKERVRRRIRATSSRSSLAKGSGKSIDHFDFLLLRFFFSSIYSSCFCCAPPRVLHKEALSRRQRRGLLKQTRVTPIRRALILSFLLLQLFQDMEKKDTILPSKMNSLYTYWHLENIGSHIFDELILQLWILLTILLNSPIKPKLSCYTLLNRPRKSSWEIK